MANYINKEIICEAYIHLEVGNNSELDLNNLKKHLKNFFDARVDFLLGESVNTEIEFFEGSIIAKLTAFAGIASLIGGAVLKYPDFRDSLKSMYEDGIMLAEAANLEMIFVTRTPRCDRLHFEARTGVIGRAAKLVTTIESLKEKALTLKAPSSYKEIKELGEIYLMVLRLDDESRRILGKVQSDEDRFCLAQGFHEAFNQLPTSLPAEVALRSDLIKQAKLKAEQIDFEAQTSFKRYEAAVKAAKDGLKKIALDSKPRNT